MRALKQNPYLVLCGFVSLIAAALLIHSQTAAFAWDEGFHLLAAQLIKNGKRPYLDFFFPQTPLNAYWNAAWMRVFGETWRASHALSALLTAGATLLTAGFVLKRFPIGSWRLALALTTAVAVGLNTTVVEYCTVGQAYGVCLFLIVAAFRLSLVSVDRAVPVWAAAAGLFSGAAAASSLLTAPVAPILLIWMLSYNRLGSRLAKGVVFAAAGAIPSVPLFLLWLQSPHQVIFNIVDYHLYYRQVEWSGAIGHDIEVIVSWLDSSQALILGLLATAGFLFIARSDWDRRVRSEFYLCGWLAVGLCVHLSSAHPTFSRYFLLVVPFVSIPATAGLYAIGLRTRNPDRPLRPVLLVTVLVALGLAKGLFERRENFQWHDSEAVAAKVAQVTPANAPLYADEQTYFLTRHAPPAGYEHSDSHKLKLKPSQLGPLHIIPREEVVRQVKAGAFATVETCNDEDVEDFDLAQVYSKKEDVGDCYVFWEKRPGKAE